MQEHPFQLFADYSQFYLQDEQASGDLSDSWTGQATADLLALAPGTMGVGTVRNMTVPVTVAVHESRPAFGDADQWDHICECGIEVPTGRLVVAGCTDYFPEAVRIAIVPGSYLARIQYGGLDTISEDGLEGDDHYRIDLWPGPVGTGSLVIKRRVKNANQAP